MTADIFQSIAVPMIPGLLVIGFMMQLKKREQLPVAEQASFALMVWRTLLQASFVIGIMLLVASTYLAIFPA